jgi:uncharacterized membrane protein
MAEENVLVIAFADPASGRAALDALTELDSTGVVELRAGAVVDRADDGKIRVRKEAGDTVPAVERHPRLAALLAVLVGPLDTLLFGNSLLALAGATVVPSEDELALGDLARSIPPGHTAVVAAIVEPEADVVDPRMAELGGIVARRSLAELEAELAASDDAVEAAGKEARRVLTDRRRTDG